MHVPLAHAEVYINVNDLSVHRICLRPRSTEAQWHTAEVEAQDKNFPENTKRSLTIVAV